MEIHKLLTDYNHGKGTTARIRYIVIHYVGALGSAEANCRYYAGGDRKASAHYYCDLDGTVWQSVEDKNIAWHCGAGSYKHGECRNANSIGIELCVRKKNTKSLGATDKDWYFEHKTVEAAVELTRYLISKYSIPADHILRHYDVTGKICPNPYVYNNTLHTWKAFLLAVSQPASLTKPSKTVNSNSPEREVRWLQHQGNLVIDRIVLKDESGRNLIKLKEDGVYGSKSREFVRAFWRLLGWKNNDTIGNAGLKTLAALELWKEEEIY